MKSRAGIHLPVHRRHKTHNRGYIHCEGRQWWTAEWGSMAANHLYDIFVSLWLQAGRRLPDGLNPKEWQARKQAALANMDSESEAQEIYRVSDLGADFLQFAHVHYRKDGQSTRGAENITYMVRPLLEALGDLPVDAFRPQDLVTYRDHAAPRPHWRGLHFRGSSGSRHAASAVPQHRAQLSAQGLFAAC